MKRILKSSESSASAGVSFKSAAMVAAAILPEEIIVQIVTRLPVKSVGRCRCVCKRWRTLFSDSQFAKLHFQCAPKHQTILFFRNFDLEILNLSHNLSFGKESLVLRNLNAPFDHQWAVFIGSCNGLVASYLSHSFLQQESLFIWNPSTRFFKKLPSRGNTSQISIFGFGYVSATDEYKAVINGEIFSSKSESWKRIETPRFRIVSSCGVLFGEALHWLFYPDVERQQVPNLYAFDLEEEEFSVMKLPSALQTHGLRNCFICQGGVSCEGCLYVMVKKARWDCGKLTYYEIDFWVMREYGNSDSWTRSFSVRIPGQPERRDWYPLLQAISVREASAFVRNRCPREEEKLDMSIIHYRNEDENSDMYMLDNDAQDMVVYEESLLS
ncbi:putative F-box domain-containing protein [Rosa chinensis]|uniref:Putative F-box domain-containing protein n=1 Tax=Rosa chinensis TaxID=74649 RepID=A0A2P6RIB2_ROSCH|nr:F-box/kelch-repeat protein At3g06240 [Rosa chinensis]PRQ46156.1 putative F-box domain-containing protein [Rosa chinensis]